MEKRYLLPYQSRGSTLAALEQDHCWLAFGPMAYDAQSLWLQTGLGCTAAQLCQTIRLVDKEKVAAIVQCPSGRSKKVGSGAKVVSAGQRIGLAGRSAGKIRRIGNAAGKTAGGKKRGDCPKISAYTFHA